MRPSLHGFPRKTASRDAASAELEIGPKFTPLPIRVLKDVVWLEFEDPPQFTASGLWVPGEPYNHGDDGKRPPVFARVVAAGPGRLLPTGKTHPMGVEVGQRVLIGAYEGHRLDWCGRHFIVVYEIAIHAIAEEQPS